MAQALEEFEQHIEKPLADGRVPDADAIARVKAAFRKKLQTLASDCLDLMPSDLQINGFEPVVRR